MLRSVRCTLWLSARMRPDRGLGCTVAAYILGFEPLDGVDDEPAVVHERVPSYRIHAEATAVHTGAGLGARVAAWMAAMVLLPHSLR